MAQKKAPAAEPAPKATPKAAPKAAPKAQAPPKTQAKVPKAQAPAPRAEAQAPARTAAKVPPKAKAQATPKAKARTAMEGVLSHTLRQAIRAAGLTAYAVGQRSGVDQRQVQRFLEHRRDLRLSSADKIAAVLGLRLVAAERLPQGTPPVASG